MSEQLQFRAYCGGSPRGTVSANGHTECSQRGPPRGRTPRATALAPGNARSQAPLRQGGSAPGGRPACGVRWGITRRHHGAGDAHCPGSPARQDGGGNRGCRARARRASVLARPRDDPAWQLGARADREALARARAVDNCVRAQPRAASAPSTRLRHQVAGCPQQGRTRAKRRTALPTGPRARTARPRIGRSSRMLAAPQRDAVLYYCPGGRRRPQRCGGQLIAGCPVGGRFILPSRGVNAEPSSTPDLSRCVETEATGRPERHAVFSGPKEAGHDVSFSEPWQP